MDLLHSVLPNAKKKGKNKKRGGEILNVFPSHISTKAFDQENNRELKGGLYDHPNQSFAHYSKQPLSPNLEPLRPRRRVIDTTAGPHSQLFREPNAVAKF